MLKAAFGFITKTGWREILTPSPLKSMITSSGHKGLWKTLTWGFVPSSFRHLSEALELGAYLTCAPLQLMRCCFQQAIDVLCGLNCPLEMPVSVHWLTLLSDYALRVPEARWNECDTTEWSTLALDADSVLLQGLESLRLFKVMKFLLMWTLQTRLRVWWMLEAPSFLLAPQVRFNIWNKAVGKSLHLFTFFSSDLFC